MVSPAFPGSNAALRPGLLSSADVDGERNQQPIIEVEGKLQFSLPVSRIFPTLTDGTILKPELV